MAEDNNDSSQQGSEQTTTTTTTTTTPAPAPNEAEAPAGQPPQPQTGGEVVDDAHTQVADLAARRAAQREDS